MRAVCGDTMGDYVAGQDEDEEEEYEYRASFKLEFNGWGVGRDPLADGGFRRRCKKSDGKILIGARGGRGDDDRGEWRLF